jgi:hypothetical protein
MGGKMALKSPFAKGGFRGISGSYSNQAEKPFFNPLLAVLLALAAWPLAGRPHIREPQIRLSRTFGPVSKISLPIKKLPPRAAFFRLIFPNFFIDKRVGA